jgi:hypothetical protein
MGFISILYDGAERGLCVGGGGGEDGGLLADCDFLLVRPLLLSQDKSTKTPSKLSKNMCCFCSISGLHLVEDKKE